MRNLWRYVKEHRIGLILIGIFMAGLFLRVWGLSSVYQRIDDIPVARHIEKIYQGQWEPDSDLYYPIFFNYIVAVVLRGISVFLVILGVHPGPGLFAFPFDQILLISRVISSLMGATTILLIYLIAKKLYSSKEALIASFFLSVSFVHILYSHQIVLDVPMTFFYALSLYFCVLIMEKGRPSHYVLAAFVGGLAVATKYNGIFIVFSILIAHFIHSLSINKKFFRLIFDSKLILAGFCTLAGFFAGHPYALLNFSHFLRASSRLIKLVHDTEWYLLPIQPGNLLEFIKYNKYVQGIVNIFHSEGAVFCVLILLGITWVVRSRKKENIFLSLSAAAYFFGALGFLGFSRWRDLSTLAIFYSFFGMFGILFLHHLLKKKRITLLISVLLLIGVFSSLMARSFLKTSILWEDDTSEIAERWIKRNIPPGSYFGKEWFSPPTPARYYRFRFFTKPYLFYRDFPPFETFDFVISTSTCSSHFLRNEKFYPEISGIYKHLAFEHELIKHFFFKEIEFKNPEVHIYSGRNPARIRQRISLPTVMPGGPLEREFEVADGSPYGKDINSFFIQENQKIERILISREKIRHVALFVESPENDGEIIIRNSFRKIRMPAEKGAGAYLVFQPALSFPFHKYNYKISVETSGNLGSAFIQLKYDEFDIGVEFFRREKYKEAREFFLKALEHRRRNVADLEIYLYLAACSEKLGMDIERQKYIDSLPGEMLLRRYAGLLSSDSDEEDWVKQFHKFSGIDTKLFRDTHTILLDSADFDATGGNIIESGALMRDSALLALPGEESPPMKAVSREQKLMPQTYTAELFFYNPAGLTGPVGDFQVVSTRGEKEEIVHFPLILDENRKGDHSSVSVSFKNNSAENDIRFIVNMDANRNVAFDDMNISPDIRDFFQEKYHLFHSFLKNINLK